MRYLCRNNYSKDFVSQIDLFNGDFDDSIFMLNEKAERPRTTMCIAVVATIFLNM